MSEHDPTIGRIIDANLNRAREALRVMEEYARFVLDDAALTEATKEARHDLASAVRHLEGRTKGLAGGPFIAGRDIVGDVGREIAGRTEYERSGARDVAVAAGRRLGEALRAIEEYGKTLDPEFAATIETLRYRGYELERRLALTIRARNRFGEMRLYVILTESLCGGDWFEAAEAALRGGADCIQLREKHLNDRELLARARRLADLCRDMGKILIINDRPDVAVASGAHGVHLGQEDLSVATVRRVVPATCIVGVSTHDVDQVRAAVAAAPDYIAVGPVFATATKPGDHVAGPKTLATADKLTSLPLVAIGGIDTHNVGSVLAYATCCICACSSIISRSDVAAAAARMRAAVDTAWGEHETDATTCD